MAITHSGTTITFSGNETGVNMRSYITANSLGSVVGRTATVNASIRPLNASSEFVDNDCTWIFTGSFHWDFTLTCAKFEIVDGVIIYTELGKSHSSQPRATNLKLENVQYRIEGGTGRTDFFTPQVSGFDFSNVQFITYGGSNFLHLATAGGLLANVSVKVGSGSLVFQPDTQNGTTLIMRNWVLNQLVDEIAGNGGSNLTAITRLENLDWANTIWSIGALNRGQYYKVINPIKPDGWVRYTGSTNLSTTRTDEFHTHNVKIVDENNTALGNFIVQLRRSDNTTVVYDLLTDSNGDITEQEILTYKQTGAGTNFTQYNGFLLGGVSYNNQIVSGIKNLAGGRIDEVITSSTDSLVTETDKTIVDAYTTIDNAQQFYDCAKAYLYDNYAAETLTIVSRIGDTIDAGSYDVTIDAAASSVFSFNGTTIIIKSSAYVGDLVTTGTVTLSNGSSVNGNVIDATSDGFLKERNGAEIRVINPSDDTVIYQGTSYAFKFADLTITQVKVFGNLGGVWLEQSELVTLLQGSNEVDFGVAGAITALPYRVWSDDTTYTGVQKGKLLEGAKNKANLAASLSA